MPLSTHQIVVNKFLCGPNQFLYSTLASLPLFYRDVLLVRVGNTDLFILQYWSCYSCDLTESKSLSYD